MPQPDSSRPMSVAYDVEEHLGGVGVIRVARGRISIFDVGGARHNQSRRRGHGGVVFAEELDHQRVPRLLVSS